MLYYIAMFSLDEEIMLYVWIINGCISIGKLHVMKLIKLSNWRKYGITNHARQIREFDNPR